MPKITITEIDNTKATISEEDFVVFVPGNVSDKAEKNEQYKYIGKTTLFGDLETFINEIGYETPTYDEIDTPFVVDGKTYDPGYSTARFLLNKGYKVYYSVPKATTGVETKHINEKDVTYTTIQSVQYTLGIKAFEGETLISETEQEEASEGIYENVVSNEYYIYDIDSATFTSTSTSEASTINYVDATATEISSWWESGSFTRDEVVYNNLSSGRFTKRIYDGTSYKIGTYANVVYAINQDSFYEDLDDKSLYQFRYLTNGGYITVNDEVDDNEDITSLTTLKQIAENRGDCIALIDHDKNILVGKTTKKDQADAILNSAKKVTSKYAAMYSPWCKYTINNVTIAMPSSMAYLEAFINGTKTNPTWYATAGRLRGVIEGKPIVEYGEKFANSLMSDNDVSVNPITNVYPYGILIWGNRTLFDNSKTQGLVASSFLNIRQLCIDLFKRLYINAKGYMFEQNSDRLWFNFKNDIVKLLDNMKTGQGISGYKIVRQTPDKRAQVKALIQIVPIEAVEEFDITVSLEDQIDVTESI